MKGIPTFLNYAGSSSSSVQAGGGQWEHACSQEFDASSPVHRPFQCLQSVDVALGWTVAPAQCHGVSHRLEVLSQRAREPLHGVDAGPLRVLDSTFELLPAPGSQQTAEPHCKAAHGRELVRSEFERVDLRRLPRRQHLPWPDA